jgi:hypothetical protein
MLKISAKSEQLSPLSLKGLSCKKQYCGLVVRKAVETVLVYSAYIVAYTYIGTAQHSMGTRWQSLCTAGRQRSEIRLHRAPS